MQLHSFHYYFHSPIYSHRNISLTSKRSWNALTMRKPSWHLCFSFPYIPQRPGTCLLEEVINERVSYWLHSRLLIKSELRFDINVENKILFILFYYFCLWRGNLREAKWRTYRKKRFSRWCACQTQKLLISLLALYGCFYDDLCFLFSSGNLWSFRSFFVRQMARRLGRYCQVFRSTAVEFSSDGTIALSD